MTKTVSLSTELLDQARHLIDEEPRRPKQASFRRGVSAAYYALFHKLTDASSKFLVAGNGEGRQELRHAIRRSYAHGGMKSVVTVRTSPIAARVSVTADGA